ncbi:MAG: proprotein convertase P-domain-containing protein [Nannocystaceae bacterium]
MLFALACTTGCPGDDVPTVTTTGEDSTGTSTGPSTVTTPTTMTTQGSTDGGTDTDPGTDTTAADSTATEGATDTDTGPVCGDGVTDDGEACDGDDIPTDCAAEGFDGGDISCNDDCTLNTDACITNCGNDIVDEGEDCDGADLGGVADCVELDPATYMGGALSCADDCTYNVRLCEVITCGDDMIDGMDVCDGTDLGGEDCVSQGFDAGTLACEAGCAAFDTSMCTYTCGDDGIDPGETCDGADLGAETCITQGFDGGTLGCAMDCGSYDTSGCFSCGDGVTNGMEVCDGADLGGEDCVSQGFPGGGTLGCAMDCGSYDTSMCSTDVCGDGIITGAEECDGADLGGAPDCITAGFLGGEVTCAADCTISNDFCFDNQTTVCSTPGIPIGPGPGDPDAVDVIPIVGGGAALVDVEVFVDASHTWATDMEIDVGYVPGGTTARMFDNGCGGANLDNMDVTYDDEAGGIPSCVSPIGGGGSGTPVQPLSAFDGQGDGAGDWQITIGDTVGGDGGTLNEWCVTLSTNSTAPFCGDGVVSGSEVCENNEIAFNTCEALGFAGGSPDCSAGCDIDTSECSNSVIAVCNSPGSLITTGAPVNDVVNIPAGSGNVADIDVHVDITHTWSADIDMTLTHNLTGTVVELSTDQCGSDDDIFAFYNDEGNGLPDCIDPIGIEGNINPEGVLADFDGELAEGDWTLNVTDDAGGDDGTLNTWCIYITP